jgi:predicted esterase
MTLGAVRAAVFQAYQEKRYQNALDLVAQAISHFPEHEVRLTNWQAVLYEALGQPEEALVVMTRFVSAGGWYSERILMDDDFQATRALPGFADLLAACRERQAAAVAAVRPELQVRCNVSAGAGAPTLVVLHGNHGDMNQSEPAWAPAADLGCVVGLAQSTQIEAPGMYVWDDWAKGENEVVGHLSQIAAHPAADAKRMVLCGFSMGAGLAAYLALKGSAPVRGFVVLGPYLPDMDQVKATLAGARERGVRGYIMCGDHDRISLEHAQHLHDFMRENGLPVGLDVIAGLGHEYPPDFRERLERALAFVLA